MENKNERKFTLTIAREFDEHELNYQCSMKCNDSTDIHEEINKFLNKLDFSHSDFVQITVKRN